MSPQANITIETGPHVLANGSAAPFTTKTFPHGIMWHQIRFSGENRLTAARATWLNGTEVVGEIEGSFDAVTQTFTPLVPERDTLERKVVVTVTQDNDGGRFADVNTHFEVFPCTTASPPQPPAPCGTPSPSPASPPALAELDFIF